MLIKKFYCRMFILGLFLFVSGCGISSDNIYGFHSETKTTFRNISSVVAGNVAGGGEGDIVILGSSQPVYLYGNFALRNLNAASIATGLPVSVRLRNGENLWSFLQGVPSRRADIIEIKYSDWHNVTGTAIAVQTPYGTPLPAEATVSINPFTNLAFWLSTNYTSAPSAFSGYTSARNFMNSSLNLSPCNVEKGLCPEQVVFLQRGYIRANSTFFAYSSQKGCRHYISRFPNCTTGRI